VATRSKLARPARWQVGALSALALLPFLTLAAFEWPSQPDLDNPDYAQYEAHAIALLQGRPYTDTGYVFASRSWGFGPRAYPPGWPLVLAGSFALFGANDAVAKAVTLAFACALLLIAGAYVGRMANTPYVGIATTVLLGLSPRFVSASVSPLSDIPFAALVWLTILVADGRGRWGPGRAAAITLTAGLAVLFRPHGLILIGALAVWALITRRERGPWAAAPPAVLALGALVGRILVPQADLRAFPPLHELWENLTRRGIGDVVAVLESHLYPFPGDVANDVYHVVSLLVMCLGLVIIVRRRPRSLALWFAPLYAFGVAALAYLGVNPRYAIPLFPLFVWGLLEGVAALAGRLRSGWTSIAPLALALSLALVATANVALGERPPPLRERPAYVELVAELGRYDPGTTRIVSFRPRALALETGIPGLVSFNDPDIRVHLEVWCAHGITHVLLGNLGIRPAADAAIRRVVESRPEAFTLEFSNDEFELYRFDPGLACEPPADAPPSGPGQLRQ